MPKISFQETQKVFGSLKTDTSASLFPGYKRNALVGLKKCSFHWKADNCHCISGKRNTYFSDSTFVSLKSSQKICSTNKTAFHVNKWISRTSSQSCCSLGKRPEELEADQRHVFPFLFCSLETQSPVFPFPPVHPDAFQQECQGRIFALVPKEEGTHKTQQTRGNIWLTHANCYTPFWKDLTKQRSDRNWLLKEAEQFKAHVNQSQAFLDTGGKIPGANERLSGPQNCSLLWGNNQAVKALLLLELDPF